MLENQNLYDRLENTPSSSQTELQLQFMRISDLDPYMQYLCKFPKLKKLSLHGNSIKILPSTMYRLDHLEDLDLSNNVISDVSSLVDALRNVQTLKRLTVRLNKKQQKYVCDNLKQLQYFNDKKIVREVLKNEPEYRYMNKKQMTKILDQMLGEVKRISKFQEKYLEEKASESEQKIKSELENYAHEALKKVHQKQEQDITENLQLIFFNFTKFQMYEIIKNKAINICMDIYGDLGKFIYDVSNYQDSIMKNLFDTSLRLLIMYEDQLAKKKSEEFKNSDTFQNRVLERNTALQKEFKRVKRMKEQLQSQKNQLQAENKRYLECLVKYSKGEKNSFSNMTLGLSSPSKKNIQSSISISPGKPIFEKSKGQNQTIQTKEISMMSHQQGQQARSLTLKQLKDIINQIYEEKYKFEKKNSEKKGRLETMHQYLFIYLNQKYGLKSLTIEAANSLVEGVKIYAGEDNDVAVFGKILRNQVDQQFKNVQIQLKTTINNLLKMHIKSQMPYKNTSFINEVFQEKSHGQISAAECEDIVNYLYNRTDAEKLFGKLSTLFKIKEGKNQHSHRIKDNKQIGFNKFTQAVLNFQLQNHQRVLTPLVRAFKSKDTDTDGVINWEEFSFIVEELCEEEGVISELMEQLSTKKLFTFSEVVRILANYPENNPILARNTAIQMQDLDDD